jgi:hypothetical protein
MNEYQPITVCDRCYRASCWNGDFLCDDSTIASTIELPIWILKKLELEHPDHWSKPIEPDVANDLF